MGKLNEPNQASEVKLRYLNTRTGGGSENHTDWRGGGGI